MLFKHIATFATFALSAVSVFAAPAVDTDATALAKRAQPKSLAQIFTAATSAVTPFTQQLSPYSSLIYCSYIFANSAFAYRGSRSQRLDHCKDAAHRLQHQRCLEQCCH